MEVGKGNHSRPRVSHGPMHRPHKSHVVKFEARELHLWQFMNTLGNHKVCIYVGVIGFVSHVLQLLSVGATRLKKLVLHQRI